MHEGLLILKDDESKKVMLSNKPSEKLIKKFLQKDKFLD